MKKHLLFLSSVFILFSSAAQNAAERSAVGTESAMSPGPSQTHKVAQFKNKAQGTACDTLNWPISSGWTGVNYYITATPQFSSGWVNGVNTYADREKAQYFDASSSPYSLLHGFFLQVGKAYSSNPNKIVTFRVYDGTSGTPGATLATRTLTMGQIMADVQNNYYTEIVFTTPVTLPASRRFFISVDVTGLTWATAPKDTFNIVSNSDPQTTPSATWEKQSDNNWYNYASASSWQLNISLYIFPYLTNTANVVSFTQTPNQSTQVCTGSPITFNASASTASQVLWNFTGGTPATSNTFIQATTWNSAGTYNVKLYTIGSGCPIYDSLASTVTIIPSPTLVPTAAPSNICPSQTSSISVTGANSYVWSPASSLSSSTGSTVIASPTVTTVYTVTGTGSNGCTASALVPITYTPAPVASVTSGSTNICVGQTVNFNATGSQNVTSYSWVFQGGTPSTSTVASPTIAYNTAGTFTVRLYASNSCGTDSSYTATVTAGCVGLDENSLNNSISTIYNSAEGHLELAITNPAMKGVYRIELVNDLGQAVYTGKIEVLNGHASTGIDLGPVSSGIYFVRISGHDVNFTRKFMKH
ncbi:MAG: PKD domain-containing protein [Bacteroidota bacterium]